MGKVKLEQNGNLIEIVKEKEVYTYCAYSFPGKKSEFGKNVILKKREGRKSEFIGIKERI